MPSSPQTNLQLYPCPAGYCRCRHDTSVSNGTCVYSYSHSDPDYQCACSRRGERGRSGEFLINCRNNGLVRDAIKKQEDRKACDVLAQWMSIFTLLARARSPPHKPSTLTMSVCPVDSVNNDKVVDTVI